MEKVTKPSQSGRPARGSCDSRTFHRVTAMATRHSGTLTKKIQRHDSPLVRTPPSTGPIATATPVTAPKAPKATPRSLPRKAPASSARAVANIAAPPMPWKARDHVSTVMSVAAPQAMEPTVNSAVPIAKSRLRP